MATPADKRFHQLKKIHFNQTPFTLAIQKAINTIETPVKEKHVRSTIIGTFQEQSATTYWMVAIRQPLQDNRIVAWKFCHVTHKLLREGHPACLDDSQRHIHMIENLGKLWVHLREGYGRLINLYCNLLVTKLKFHARNPRFPGNMLLTVDELDAIAENDVNNYFQICVELFDYMDDILTLQAAVFDSLGNARANSMTASGQCRLAALIPCAQDSSHIYDCNVRLLFRLHASLPPDVLAGHRERFRQQFKKLSSFYKHASSLQYYRNLLTLPVLPSNPPNFLLQSDFGTYVAPVVSIPEQPPDDTDTVGSLIDTSDTISQVTTPDNMDMVDTRATPSPIPDPIVERDRLIEHLQNELRRMRSEVSQIIQERNTMLGSMREHCTRMESQLRATKNELEEEKQKAEVLLVETPQIKKKLTDTEEKSKVLDEKFQKLKGAYTQLREEHIALIRQKAEVDKLSASLRAAAAQHESAKTALQQQLNDRTKHVELLQQSASSSEEIEAYKNEIAHLRSDLEQSRLKEAELESLKASIETLEIEHKTATTEQQEKLTVLVSDLKEAKESIEKLKTEVTDKESELSKVKEELVGLRAKSSDEYKKAIEEKEDALKQLSELKQRYEQEKEEYISNANILEGDLNILQTKLTDAQNNFESQCRELKEELSLKNEKFENILNEKNNEIKEALAKLILLQNEMENVKNNKEKLIQEQSNEINEFKQNINEFLQEKKQLEVLIEGYVEQIKKLDSKVLQEQENKIQLEVSLSQKALECQTLIVDKQELEKSLMEWQSKHIDLTVELDKVYQDVQFENALKCEIEDLKTKYARLEIDKDTETKILKDELEREILEKDEAISEAQKTIDDLMPKITELELIKENNLKTQIQNDNLLVAISAKDKEIQLTEARLKHTESERLTAECELQDLLQHNTVLEADMASLKIQLDEANALIKKQSWRLVACAGESALEVVNGALSAFEHSNAQDANKLAAQLASKAFEDLARKDQIEGNEELVAKSSIFAAHNAAQLSAYVADLSNISTDLELSDKLNNECRSMLTSTKQCLETITGGSLDRASCMEARVSVQSVALTAAAADRLASGARSVDDELADMDSAIEDAANQIESLLAASRAGDSGVKLEVNEKILDACTTLMGAVKLLVQESRKLQNELGDPKTRQKMYRRNPQWSEGLISASKAVVFAAKLLVSSADEAVGAAGRVEGVSAAAHEVAGSTAQLVAASRARAPPAAPALARLTAASRAVAAATGAVVAAVRGASALVRDQETLDTSALSLTATRRLEMDSKVRALELESALEAERSKLAALRKRHYHLAQLQENGNVTNGEE
ncbi:huntingtin-interacting protein 1-related protein isoform X2 [Maniola jurtina]|uniref:huntingtin-interacting protein 1-related protein isoform X2 n=1 Tax=Maniola jurtina TaxID=191418 RepID=UPI001E6894B5|nr:huntingtin-interacting protein 1-related protein isoform X2 [Maniola jurtina]XP_045772400.1 huntingtin-interacting protein 1-related protein isoform X2 [Maniola jurtina]